MKTTAVQLQKSIKIRNTIIVIMTIVICVLACFALRNPKTAQVSFFEQLIRNYSNAIFECTAPDQNAKHIWGVFEEKLPSKASNFQEKEIINGFTDSGGYMIHVYPDMGGIYAIATCPSQGQAEKLAKILAILKDHGSKYGTVFDW